MMHAILRLEATTKVSTERNPFVMQAVVKLPAKVWNNFPKGRNQGPTFFGILQYV